MDIAALSYSMSQSALAVKVSTAVTKLAMNASVENSQSMVSMMEKSVNPNLGGNIDIKV